MDKEKANVHVTLAEIRTVGGEAEEGSGKKLSSIFHALTNGLKQFAARLYIEVAHENATFRFQGFQYRADSAFLFIGVQPEMEHQNSQAVFQFSLQKAAGFVVPIAGFGIGIGYQYGFGADGGIPGQKSVSVGIGTVKTDGLGKVMVPEAGQFRESAGLILVIGMHAGAAHFVQAYDVGLTVQDCVCHHLKIDFLPEIIEAVLSVEGHNLHVRHLMIGLS